MQPGGEAVIMLCHKWPRYSPVVCISGIGYETQGIDAPRIASHSRRDARRLYNNFSTGNIHMTGFSVKTVKRHGLLVDLYDSVFVSASTGGCQAYLLEYLH